MLSILVPIYNHNIIELAKQLVSQCSNNKIECEIIFTDDCSNNKQIAETNSSVSTMPTVEYTVLKENLGRAKIRNFLADKAKGDWLLFLDCDCLPCNSEFIINYLAQVGNADIICGGTKYNNKNQLTKDYFLHWKNGKQREEGRHHFTTNNFLIKKQVFEKVRFDEEIKGYGHEDTLFACEVKKNNYKIAFINNPVEHLGLKTTDKFIEDTITASRNLAILYNNLQYKENLKEISLIKTYEKLNSLHLVNTYRKIVSLFNKILMKQLHSNRPCLKFLDIIKLYNFCNCVNKLTETIKA